MEVTMSTNGKAIKFGDNIDTDVIIAARYLVTADAAELAKHCMEDMDPTFTGRVNKGDIMIGGRNFGCGSSREHAPLAIKGVGISCVIAKTFARIFYRNAINIGLPILQCPEAVDGIGANDTVEVDTTTGKITNVTTGKSWNAMPFPEFMQQLISAGGLIAYAKKKIAEGEGPKCGCKCCGK
jgi:3-isopropylmalate/(R)-2-methylmalate dehydratase small subunit